MRILNKKRVVHAAATVCSDVGNLLITLRIVDPRTYQEWAALIVAPKDSFYVYTGDISLETSEISWYPEDVPENIKNLVENNRCNLLEKMKTLLTQDYKYATHVMHPDSIEGFRGFENRIPPLSKISIYLFHTAAEQHAFETGLFTARPDDQRDTVLDHEDLIFLEKHYKKEGGKHR